MTNQVDIVKSSEFQSSSLSSQVGSLLVFFDN